MRPCAGCGEPFRKGKRRGLLQEDGTVRVTLVCARCAARAFAVVRPMGSAAHACTLCHDRPARVCSDCARRTREALVGPVVRALRAMVEASRLQGREADERAYDHAICALLAQAGQG